MSNPDSFWNHPIEKLEKALQIRKQIAALQDALGKVFGNTLRSAPETRTPASPTRKKKRTMSPAARARIVAGQKARWAKIKKPKTAAAPVPAKAAPAVKAPKKGGMSAEGRARIVAAQKARWAKIKGGKAPAKPAPAKAVAAPKKKKGGISPEGRARIQAAQKLRWAKVKKAAGKQNAGRRKIAAEGQPVFRVL